MSETRWTPGPWVLGTEYNCHTNIQSADGGCIAKTDCYSDANYQPHNARLIVAAPELYEALEEALDLIDREHGSLYSDVQRKGRAALAKAEAK